MSERQGRRIVALVLSHNAPLSLARCLHTINAQTQVPEEVLVVDNASQPAVDATSLPEVDPSLHIIRSELNGGPAGGWSIALRSFLSSDFTHAWVMDDDIVPDPTCLEALWDAASDDPPAAFAFPIAIQPDGVIGRWGYGAAFSSPGRSWRPLGSHWKHCSGGRRTPNTASGESLRRVIHVASSRRRWFITMPSARAETFPLGSTITSLATRCTTTFTSCIGWAAIRGRSSPCSSELSCGRSQIGSDVSRQFAEGSTTGRSDVSGSATRQARCTSIIACHPRTHGVFADVSPSLPTIGVRLA